MINISKKPQAQIIVEKIEFVKIREDLRNLEIELMEDLFTFIAKFETFDLTVICI